MMDDQSGFDGRHSDRDDLIEIDLNFESMRRFQAEFSPNLSEDGLFIDTGEPLSPGSVVRFRVILPEDFVFLEGTSVVEWTQSAEEAGERPPGMALRFVTLSPQNQELVAQLVQDHRDAGGTPFDIDVRPVPTDFPTDALEGAPTPADGPGEEGYRLTVRRTGPNLEAEALQTLSEPLPEESGDHPSGTPEPRGPQPEEPRGFEIVSGPPKEESRDETAPAAGAAAKVESKAQDTAVADIEKATDQAVKDVVVGEVDRPSREAIRDVVVGEVERPSREAVGDVVAGEVDEPPGEAVDDVVAAEVDEPPGDDVETADEAVTGKAPEHAAAEVVSEDAAEAAAEPPKLDWSVWKDDPIEPVEVADEPRARESEVEDPVGDEPEQAPPEEPEFLPTPADFDDGSEVLRDVQSEGTGGTAFDVSLPDADDEPDTTPVLPDDGGSNEVTVAPDDDGDRPGRRRRLWPMALGVVVVLVVIGGFLWPSLQSRIGRRTVDRIDDTQSMVADVAGGDVGAPDDADPVERPPEISEAPIESLEDEAGENAARAGGTEGDDVPAASVEPESEVGPEPTAPPEIVELSPADAVTGIVAEPGAGGTVITISGNGSFEDGIISMEKLSSPPRVLVRVRGIVTGFRPYTIEASTPEVTTLRSGLHEERRPPELWVVVDLTGSEVTVGGIDIRRDVAQFTLSRP